MTTNTTCNYSSKAQAPAGKLCGDLIEMPKSEFVTNDRGCRVRASWKYIGQIRKTGDNEFTVYGQTGIVGVYAGSAFAAQGSETYAGRIIRRFSLK